MTTVMITGANRGLGLEFTRQYLQDGAEVIATCRNPQGAEALAAIKSQYGARLFFGRLDMLDWASIDELAEQLSGRGIDCLILNAGAFGPAHQKTGAIDYDAWMTVLRTNVMGPYKTAMAFLPHVKAAGPGKIIAISSLMGSITDNTSGGYYIYRSSKAALNAVIKNMGQDLQAQGIPVGILHPGWVKTDMGGAAAPLLASHSVSAMRKVIDGLGLAQTAQFFNYDGATLPW